MDLLPPRMKLQIFVDMPWRIRLKTCLAPLAGKSPQEVMTPAVADPTYLGYAKLYRMMLDLVRVITSAVAPVPRDIRYLDWVPGPCQLVCCCRSSVISQCSPALCARSWRVA